MIPLLFFLFQDLSQQGAQAMREGRFADAERVYRQLVKEQPAVAQWRMNLGLALHSAARYTDAITELTAYLKSSPQPGPAHFILGVDQLKLGKPCEAIAPLEQARRWQKTKQVLTELGDAYSGCKRFAQAAPVLEEAGLPRFAARAYWQAAQYPQAKRLYAATAAQFPAEAAFQFEYGDTLFRIDGAQAALPVLERAVRLDPRLLQAQAALGKAYVELERFKDAIPCLEAAAPQDPTLLLPLSRSYKATGRPEEAARALEQYRKKAQN